MRQIASYPTDSPLPRVRNIEVIPVDQGGGRMFYVRDPLEIAPQPLLLGPAGMLVLSHLDGRRTMDQILESLQKAIPGGEVGVGEVRRVLGKLSEGCYLDDPVAADRIARVRDEFERAEVRPAWHAGTAYPNDPGELAGMLDGFFETAASSVEARRGDSYGDRKGRLAAIMCPHIDLRAGGETYPPAFNALAAASGCESYELFVILGVAHNGGTEPGKSFAIATGKHYETPFGRVATDTDVIGDWSSRTGRDVTEQQWMHRTEHSVEFAVLFLQYIQAREDLAPFQVVPVLLGSVDHYLREGRNPLHAHEVASELEALREAVSARGMRALYVLSVDLAHIGPKFGHPDRVDDAAAAACESVDRDLLGYVQRFDAPGLFRTLKADGNGRNVDAVSGLFSLHTLLAGAECRGDLLGYGQNRQDDTGSLVSYASMAFYQSLETSAPSE
ncbi:MAG: AmmeMemoRadiSam system protein B [Gemmatimonadota bacterium]|nr:AmmeMemoRadiSam system protein B [Gemmatimonadota bacterium]